MEFSEARLFIRFYRVENKINQFKVRHPRDYFLLSQAVRVGYLASIAGILAKFAFPSWPPQQGPLYSAAWIRQGKQANKQSSFHTVRMAKIELLDSWKLKQQACACRLKLASSPFLPLPIERCNLYSSSAD